MSNKKLNWLLDNVDIHDDSLRHELFVVVRSLYPQADEETKARLIKAIKTYEAPANYDRDKKKLEASVYLNWFDWLSKSNPNCSLAKQALKEVQEQHPDMKPYHHPEFPHYMETGARAMEGFPRIPLTASDLIAKPIDGWLESLLNYDEDGMYPAAIEKGFLIRELVEKNIGRSFELAQVLAEKEKWDADIWASLIAAWGEKGDLSDENIRSKVLDWLDREKIYPYCQLEIAKFIESLVNNGGKGYTPAILDRLDEIGKKLLEFIQDQEENIEEPDMDVKGIFRENNGESKKGIDFHRIYGRLGSQLALFFMSSIEIRRKGLEPKPNKMTDEYRCTLSKIIDKSLWGLGVLASQFNFLQAIDEGWVKEKLLPCFNRDKDVEKYQAAWSGFLFWGSFSPNTVNLLSPMFLKAVRHLKEDFTDSKERFIEFYTYMMIGFVDNPLDEWIPAFFQNTNLENHQHFAHHIEMQLMHMDESPKQKLWDSWLKQYWENRLSGRPIPLAPAEAAIMLGWVAHLGQGGLFPEVVKLAIKMPAAEGFAGHMLGDISKSNQASLYPEDMAKFLIYLGRGDDGIELGLRRYASKIIEKLPLEKLPPNLGTQIQELKARLV